MKQLNDLTVIGLDHGYGNIKTANTVLPTAITAYTTKPIFEGDVLEYGGKYYRVGEGHKAFIADKAGDDDFYLLTLAAAARELEMYRIYRANVHLAVGLPLSWVGVQRDRFRQYLLRQQDVTFRYNGAEYWTVLLGDRTRLIAASDACAEQLAAANAKIDAARAALDA